MIESVRRDGMVPLRRHDPDWVRFAADAPHRSTAFRHATLQRRPGLWGDDPERPTAAVWLREGDGGWEAFGAGRASPAVGWLAARSGGKRITMLAPPSWERPIRKLGGRVELGTILTLSRAPGSAPPPRVDRVPVRGLTPDDGEDFRGVAPDWALRSWSDFEAMLTRGIAFGVPMPGGLASVAWTYESDPEHHKIGVATLPRYRNLGLGTATASALVRRIVATREKTPLWVTTPENPASIAVAESLGFTNRVEERLIRWSPADPAVSRPSPRGPDFHPLP